VEVSVCVCFGAFLCVRVFVCFFVHIGIHPRMIIDLLSNR
jgi:hypothetical protein